MNTFLFFVGGEVIGGNELVLCSLMSRLKALGHRAIAMVSVWNDSAYPRMLDAAGIEHHEIPLGRFYLSNFDWTRGAYYNLPDAVRVMRRVVSDTGPDWIVLSESQSLLLCSVVISQPKRALYLHAKPDRLMSNWLLGRMIAHRVQRILCPSNYIAECVRGSAMRRGAIAVVPNGTAVPDERRPAAAGSPVRIGIVGRVNEQKQHMTLLRALALLKQRPPPHDFRLDIVGAAADAHASRVRAEIARLGLDGLVSWRGFVEGGDRVYEGIDVVVAPGLDEAFGMTVVEAGARGLPVVAARSGAFPEIVVDGTTGLLFGPENAAELARALDRLIGDYEARRRLGEAARARVRSRFTVAMMADRFVQALN